MGPGVFGFGSSFGILGVEDLRKSGYLVLFVSSRFRVKG